LLKENPDAMRQCKQIVEHPYGTIKDWMGSTHFLMKRLANVQTETSLHVLAYNLRRAINILGVPKIMKQLQVGNQHSRCAQDHETAAGGLSGPFCAHRWFSLKASRELILGHSGEFLDAATDDLIQ